MKGYSTKARGRSHVVRNTLAVMACAAAIAFAACSSQAPSSSAIPAANADGGGSSSAQNSANSDDTARLRELWRQRTAENTSGDFTLGPGDVLDISVPAIDALKDREVRVSGDDTIALPLVGVMDVKGQTEQGIRDELKERLTKYMYNPQVDVFAKEYESRQVAVVGMVQKPGLYTLTSSHDTVLSMISRAGGENAEGAQRILLIPAPAGQSAQTSFLLAAAAQMEDSPDDSNRKLAPVSERAQQPQNANAGVAVKRDGEGQNLPASYQPQSAQIPAQLAAADPIAIDLTNVRSELELDIPARPGDVIIVPAAGEVMVKGWVKNPGAFKVSNGMTVLGAIAAAGGEMFSSDAVILRSGKAGGDKTEIPVDLSAIQKGAAPDLPIQGGDVVVVKRSAVGAVPYALYMVFSKFGTGVYPALPMF